MKKFSMKCSCGHVFTVDANAKEEAVEKMKEMMDQNAIEQHWMQNHQNDPMPKPTLEQSHMQIEQNMAEGEAGEGTPPMPPPTMPPPSQPPAAM